MASNTFWIISKPLNVKKSIKLGSSKHRTACFHAAEYVCPMPTYQQLPALQLKKRRNKFMQLNSCPFQIIGTSKQLTRVTISSLHVGNSAITPVSFARSLGPWFDAFYPSISKTFVECLVIWRGGSIWNSTQQMQIPNDNPFSIVFISVTISVPLMDYPFQKKKSPYPIQHSVKASREIRVSWQRQSRTDKKIIQRTECILSL